MNALFFLSNNKYSFLSWVPEQYYMKQSYQMLFLILYILFDIIYLILSLTMTICTQIMVKLKLVYAIRVAYLLVAGIVTFRLFQTVSLCWRVERRLIGSL